MIRPRDLRPGSMVIYNECEWKIWSITGPYPNRDKRYDGKWTVDLAGDGMLTVLLSEVEPIPATYERLRYLGFEPYDYSKRWLIFGNHCTVVQRHNGDWIFCHHMGHVIKVSKHHSGDAIKIFHSIHEFQNLYWDISDEQLEFGPAMPGNQGKEISSKAST